MVDKILWEYLGELPEQKTAWCRWFHHLSGWLRFNTFYTYYLEIEGERAKSLECTTPCAHGCPRQIVEISPYDIEAVCPLGEVDPVQLEFRDILIYSLRRDTLHQAICVSLKIDRPSGNIWREFGNTWYIGDYCDGAKIHCSIYLTYRTATLPETISSLCRLHQEPFMLMAPTRRGLAPEVQELLDKNSSVLFSMEAELSLQPDGSFVSSRRVHDTEDSARF